MLPEKVKTRLVNVVKGLRDQKTCRNLTSEKLSKYF